MKGHPSKPPANKSRTIILQNSVRNIAFLINGFHDSAGKIFRVARVVSIFDFDAMIKYNATSFEV